MTDIFLPLDVVPNSSTATLLGSTGRFVSPLSGGVRTVSRPGERWGFRLDWHNLTALKRARLEAVIAGLRGGANRLLVVPRDFPQRGSFPATELFGNNDLSQGASFWTATGGITLATVDRRLRGTFTAVNTTVGMLQSVTNLTPNAPHVARYMLRNGLGSPLTLGGFASYIEGTNLIALVASVEGLNTVSLVPDAASGTQYPFWVNPPNAGQFAGNYIELEWASLSRCFLVDNAPNLLLQSNSFGTSPWSPSGCNCSNNGTNAPDGSLTAQYLQESTSTNVEHYTSQTITTGSGQQDWTLSVSLIANVRGWAVLRLYNSGEDARAFFNLSTGTVGSITLAGTGKLTNARAAIVPQGAGWYRCSLTVAKGALSSLQAIIESSTGDGVFSYTGVANTVAILMWGASAAQSSVPTRYVPTTSSAASAQPQTGSALYVKGLPPSGSGLLLPGDWCEINKELKRCTTQLDSSAAGLGYLQFAPPIRNSPNDNDPVIVNTPMGRFIPSQNQTGWSAEPGPNAQPFGGYSLDLIEAAT